MDRALKERLVGAVVLVALGVWLIPLFLDGPDPESATTSQTQQVSLPLPDQTQAKPGVQTKTIEVRSKAPATKPQETPPAREKPPASPPKVAASKPAPRPQAEKKVPATPNVADDGWFVQLGSFGSPDNAKRLAKQVDALGWDARVSPFVTDGKTLHRVRVGPSPTRSKAESVAKQLAQRGFSGQVRQADS